MQPWTHLYKAYTTSYETWFKNSIIIADQWVCIDSQHLGWTYKGNLIEQRQKQEAEKRDKDNPGGQGKARGGGETATDKTREEEPEEVGRARQEKETRGKNTRCLLDAFGLSSCLLFGCFVGRFLFGCCCCCCVFPWGPWVLLSVFSVGRSPL